MAFLQRFGLDCELKNVYLGWGMASSKNSHLKVVSGEAGWVRKWEWSARKSKREGEGERV